MDGPWIKRLGVEEDTRISPTIYAFYKTESRPKIITWMGREMS
jgi:hypothetical protein